jgi:hypothetical protein
MCHASHDNSYCSVFLRKCKWWEQKSSFKRIVFFKDSNVHQSYKFLDLLQLFLFKVINAFKRELQLKPEKTASSKTRKSESILSTEINLTTGSDEGEEFFILQEYLFTSSISFNSSKTKLAKSLHPITNH